MLQADIDKLNELAQKLEQNGTAIDDLDIRTRPSPSLPGVEIGQSFAELAEKTEGAYLRIADRMRAVAGATKACANDMSMTDEGFAARMNELDFKPAQS